MDVSRIRESMEVIGADGAHIGTVDRLDGQRIKLKKQDKVLLGDIFSSCRWALLGISKATRCACPPTASWP